MHFSRRKCFKYFGHVISENGIVPDSSKTDKVSNWPTPSCLTQLQSFLGLANYYLHFIQNFSELARPLHELTGKDKSFLWTEQCDRAFLKLKQQLTTAPSWHTLTSLYHLYWIRMPATIALELCYRKSMKGGRKLSVMTVCCSAKRNSHIVSQGRNSWQFCNKDPFISAQETLLCTEPGS